MQYLVILKIDFQLPKLDVQIFRYIYNMNKMNIYMCVCIYIMHIKYVIYIRQMIDIWTDRYRIHMYRYRWYRWREDVPRVHFHTHSLFFLRLNDFLLHESAFLPHKCINNFQISFSKSFKFFLSCLSCEILIHFHASKSTYISMIM